MAQILTSPVPATTGGLGRHAAELLTELRRIDPSSMLLSPLRATDSDHSRYVPTFPVSPLVIRTLLRDPGRRTNYVNASFDRRASQVVRRRPVADVTAFAGSALATLRSSSGGRILVAANSHAKSLESQHEKAFSRWPFERSWANRHFLNRLQTEYAIADTVRMASPYVWDSFVQAGHDPAHLVLDQLSAHPRFAAARWAPNLNKPQVITYTGSLTVVKGVPLLVELLAALPNAEVELRLIGGWSTRGMREFISLAMTRDSRISVVPGDPEKHLVQSSLHLHPSFEDGFAYAVAESIDVGVPTLVSSDTGAKFLLEPDDILPTGDLDAWVDVVRQRLNLS